MSNHEVAVLMAAYNCAPFVKQAINSILNQSHEHIKLLIVDDASTDSTWDIISSVDDPRIIRFRNSSNIGYLNSMNFLFGQVESPFITFQDADDWSNKDRLATQLSVLTDQSIDACGCFSVREYADQSVLKKYPETHARIKGELDKGIISLFCGSSIMIKAHVLKTVGVYNPIFHRIGSEDIEWYTRIIEQFKVANINKPLYHYRQHIDSLSSQTLMSSHASISADIVLLIHKLRSENKTVHDEIIRDIISDYSHHEEQPSDLKKLYSLSLKGDKQLIQNFYNIDFSDKNLTARIHLAVASLISLLIRYSPQQLLSYLNRKGKNRRVNRLREIYLERLDKLSA